MRNVKRFIIPFVLILLLMNVVPVLAQSPDPNGSVTAEANPNAAVNFAWTLIAGFLVFFMQAGFAMVEAGLSRAKNTVAVLTKNLMDGLIGGLAFWAFGFAFMFGGSALASGLEQGNPFIGLSGFMLSGAAYDVTTMELWFFQMVFAATAATIVSGSVAERTKVPAYLAYSFLISAIVYPIYGHWVWGGGWLSTLPFGVGARDFAGSGVVHAVGGFVALAGAAAVGPRLGKYNSDGTPNAIPGHSLTLVALGTFILFFGWFGFNPGSTLAATDLRISVIAVNTFLAGAAGAVLAVYYSLFRTGKIDLALACNGALAGLVGITAPCAYVSPLSAVIIGLIAAVVMIWAVGFVERTLKVDDVVGAVAVHGFGGLWGLLAVGIFADGTYGDVSGLIVGDTGQIIAQLISVVVVAAWSLIMGFGIFSLLKATMGLRATREEEIMGLDIPEHGTPAYPVDPTASAPLGSTSSAD
ncbi:MAG: ammonium transporter [Chloroflexi bacterium]|jgi:Amt family ammonium transporter|nr:ammonium transporter [Anaerolineaceae bacterium]NMB89692.1 ammonium transporter [Chloroflexota bacterium]